MALAIDPTAPATLYAAAQGRVSDGGGVQKSIDGGGHWSPSNAGLPDSFVTALALGPKRPGTVYAGFSSDCEVWGVVKSVDGGAHWAPINTGFPPSMILDGSCVLHSVRVLVVDPVTPAIIYAGTDIGIFKTTDDGAHWAASNGGLDDLRITALAIDPQTPATVYAATGLGVYKSVDGGLGWIVSNTGLPLIILSPPPMFEPVVFSLAVHPQNAAIVYAGTMAGVYQTTDGGKHWSPILISPSRTATVTIDPQNPDTLYATIFLGGVLRSTDGGGSWSPLDAGLSNFIFTTSIQVSPSGACLHVGTYLGVFDFATRSDPCAPLVNLVAAILPASRSARVGAPVTAFATVINADDKPAVGVGISLVQFQGSVPATLMYQVTDPQTNAVIGLPNTPVDIAPGASQSYVIALTPTDPFDAADVVLAFEGSNTYPVTPLVGINTLLLSASPTPVPDIMALAATLSNDGIVNIPGTDGTGIFAVATVNLGASGSITATTDTGAGSPPVTIAVCQTDPGQGFCLQAPGSSVTTQIDGGQTPTFGFFVTGTGTVPFDPATNRIFVRFKDGAGVTRGATSVAVRTQ